jgi:hypothetical protein
MITHNHDFPPPDRLAPNVHVVRGDMDEGPAVTAYPEHKVRGVFFNKAKRKRAI